MYLVYSLKQIQIVYLISANKVRSPHAVFNTTLWLNYLFLYVFF
jgi:hypothetical protein